MSRRKPMQNSIQQLNCGEKQLHLLSRDAPPTSGSVQSLQPLNLAETAANSGVFTAMVPGAVPVEAQVTRSEPSPRPRKTAARP